MGSDDSGKISGASYFQEFSDNTKKLRLTTKKTGGKIADISRPPSATSMLSLSTCLPVAVNDNTEASPIRPPRLDLLLTFTI